MIVVIVGLFVIQLYKILVDQPEKTPEADPLNVPLINQMAEPRLYNGCEVSSLAMILQDAGIHVTKNELNQKIPKVPLTYENGLKGNPNEGFVGDMAEGPGLSVYHGPLVQLARRYADDRVEDLTGSNISQVYQKIDQGIPVWVITTTQFAPVNNMQTWQTPQGKVKITFSVHSVVMTGYSDQYVWINNPYGKKNQRVDRSNFEKAWIQMGRQAIVINQ
ncbi:C39 family peptidase [Tuberibacillus sp. Marseille-P3662]|uniref:C39 family peptidase n=1 Tax=Tuberibacillus sp. Marseille-P3662 TaxID=1965358 RepID=UPI000A1CF037|nr:C39 family peptidase [Tuberibacillus sp. Marseille-P3662]